MRGFSRMALIAAGLMAVLLWFGVEAAQAASVKWSSGDEWKSGEDYVARWDSGDSSGYLVMSAEGKVIALNADVLVWHAHPTGGAPSVRTSGLDLFAPYSGGYNAYLPARSCGDWSMPCPPEGCSCHEFMWPVFSYSKIPLSWSVLPLPAGAWLLISGLGALVLLRRRA